MDESPEMSTINRIQLPNGSIYGFEDIDARDEVSYIRSDVDELEERVNSLKSDLVDKLYPVGSIYMSVIDKDPGTFIGGRWKRIKDCFLLAAGNKYPAGSEGGEATHTLSAAEMPSHAHTVHIWDPQGTTGGAQGASAATYGATLITVPNGATTSLTWNTSTPMAAMNGMGDPAGVTEFSGGNQPHNNMPPYVTVYVWLRIDYSLDW